MRRKWFLLFILVVPALIFSIGLSGVQAQLTFQDEGPPKTAYVPGEVLVKFKDVPVAKGHRTLRGAQVQAFVDRLPAQARFALGEIRGRGKRAFPSIGVLQVELPMDLSVGQAITMLKRSSTVDYAEPNYIVRAFAKGGKPGKPDKPDKPGNGGKPKRPKFPRDSYFDSPPYYCQWGLHNTGQTFYVDIYTVWGTPDADIDAPEAWALRTGSSTSDGRETIVTVIDTGVKYDHEDLKANMWVNDAEENGTSGVDDDSNGYVDDVYGIQVVSSSLWYPGPVVSGDPRDDNGHGTHVAGILGAVGNNRKGVCGVNWSTQIMALKFLDILGYGEVADAVACIEYALAHKGNNRMVINASWGDYTTPPSSTLNDIIAEAKDRNVLMVAAAGNAIMDIDAEPVYPACYNLDNIISVAASDEDDIQAEFLLAGGGVDSNYGATNVDLFAPGRFILSTYLGFFGEDAYGYADGTSMATPYVTGAAALVWAQKDEATPGTSYGIIKDLILNNVDSKDSLSGQCATGGRLNLNNALKAAGQ